MRCKRKAAQSSLRPALQRRNTSLSPHKKTMVGTARHSAGDAIADAAREPIEIVIDGKRVDVTDMIKKHPGGNILRFYKDQDATLAFNEFHSRSPSARKWLNSLPSRPTDESLSTLEKVRLGARSLWAVRQSVWRQPVRDAPYGCLHWCLLCFASKRKSRWAASCALCKPGEGRARTMTRRSRALSLTLWGVFSLLIFFFFFCSCASPFVPCSR